MRIPLRQLLVGLAAFSAVAAIVLPLARCVYTSTNAYKCRRAITDARPLIAGIERYHREKGTYADSLEVLIRDGYTPPGAMHWHYVPRENAYQLLLHVSMSCGLIYRPGRGWFVNADDGTGREEFFAGE